MGERDEDGLLERLETLAALLPVLEAPDIPFGRWEQPPRTADGTYRLAYFEPGPGCDALRAAVARGGWMMVGFDWPTWARTGEAQTLWRDPAALAAATPDQLARFLTALIRSDRFSEGTLDEAYESGLLARIARRAATLADERRASTGRATSD